MEKPILFSTEMVKAILAGRKTMTRRVIKDKVFQEWQDVGFSSDFIKHPDNSWSKKCPYGQVGDILWVRETWNVDSVNDHNKTMAIDFKAIQDGYHGAEVIRRFKPERYTQFRKFYQKAGWQSSLFMPREAARILLKVTNIRVERLQDITETDAMDEGALRIPNTPEYQKAFDAAVAAKEKPPLGETPRQRFARLWDSLNTERGYGWDLNPWVWVVEFERVKMEDK